MFRMGDRVTVKHSCSGANPGRVYTLGYGGINNLSTLDERGERNCSCEGNWVLINNCGQSAKTIMSNIKEFAKNLLLLKEEKLLREQGLKDECGNYTQDAKDLVIEKVVKENEVYLIEIAEKKKAEEVK